MPPDIDFGQAGTSKYTQALRFGLQQLCKVVRVFDQATKAARRDIAVSLIAVSDQRAA